MDIRETNFKMGNKMSVKIVPSIDESEINRKFALGIIDYQNDFITGSLAVSEAESILGPINKLRFIYFDKIPTFISLDSHPENHMSFAKTNNAEQYTKKNLQIQMEDNSIMVVDQDMWPVHCVNGTHGAKLHQDLILTNMDKFIRKGTKANVESYSVFGDENNGKYEKTDLEDWLKLNNITDLVLTGLATDFCVYYTALDGIRLGYKVHLIQSCTKGVKDSSTKEALNDMKSKGVLLYENVDKFCELNKGGIIYSLRINEPPL